MSQDYIIVIVLVIVGGYWFYTRSSTGSLRISPEEAKRRLDSEKGIILLDVRTPEEHRQNHIPKSKLIPLNTLANEASKKLPDKEANIIVYCRSGNRSRAAARILSKQGYANVSDLGGIIRWPYKTVTGK